MPLLQALYAFLMLLLPLLDKCFVDEKCGNSHFRKVICVVIKHLPYVIKFTID